jgi:hypothetical protein
MKFAEGMDAESRDINVIAAPMIRLYSSEGTVRTRVFRSGFDITRRVAGDCVRGRRTKWDGSEANPDASRRSDALDQLHDPDLRFWVSLHDSRNGAVESGRCVLHGSGRSAPAHGRVRVSKETAPARGRAGAAVQGVPEGADTIFM